MIKSKMELVERIFCDNCGKDITMSNRTTVGGLDFCLKIFSDTDMYCADAYKMRLKLNEQRKS